MAETKTIGIRLAIRKEGEWVNAYVAMAETMDGALHIGSLALGLARQEDFFDRWKAIMSDAMSLAVEDAFGQKPDMVEQRAPEHERAGQA